MSQKAKIYNFAGLTPLKLLNIYMLENRHSKNYSILYCVSPSQECKFTVDG